MWRQALFIVLMVVLIVFGATGCASAPPKQTHRDVLEADSQFVLQSLLGCDRSLALLLDSSAGYAVIPDCAAGRGIVYDCDGTFLGYVSKPSSSGANGSGGAGVVVVFETQTDLEQFMNGSDVKLTSGAKVIVLNDGVSNRLGFTRGIAIVTLERNEAAPSVRLDGQTLEFRARPDPDLLAVVPTQR